MRRKAQAKRRVPVAVYACGLCCKRQTIWGTPVQRDALRKYMTGVVHYATMKIPGMKKEIGIPELANTTSCPTCTRDLHHYACYGAYPRGSILWDLRLDNPRIK